MMHTADVIQETYEALSANKVRSGLTMLGIVIGISSVIALVAIGQGAQQSVQSSIQSLGSNLVMVQPGAQRGPGFQISTGRGSAQSLKNSDADAIAAQVSGITAVAVEVSGRYQVVAKGTNTNTSVVGTDANYPAVRNLQVAEGSFIDDGQIHSTAKVAVVGPTVVTDLFGDGADAIGQTVRIKGIPFTIIGVTVAKGGSGFSNQDDMIYIPVTTAQLYLAGNQYLSSIDVQASSANIMTQVQDDITLVLLDAHHISDPTQADFSTLNQADIVSAASGVATTFTYLLGAVAGISLLVGGIGIMNMMLTTVTERTREIGLRKAIGAKQADISRQFLVESVALTFIGGLIGAALGISISMVVSHLGVIAAQVTVSSVLLAFGVSALIGIVFGYYPARRAAGLNPIEALRYE